jgi:hypothetical protein
MFFKKKKPDAPAEQHQAIAPAAEQSASGGQSMFAPGLNVNPSTQIDFGLVNFSSEPTAAYQQTSSTSFDPWNQDQAEPQAQALPTEPFQPSAQPYPLPHMSEGETAWNATQPVGPVPGMPPLDTTYPVQTGVDQFAIDQINVDYVPVDQAGVAYPVDGQWLQPLPPIPPASTPAEPPVPLQEQLDYPDYVPPAQSDPTLNMMNTAAPLPVQPLPTSGDLTPEQAWSMLQPTQSAPLLPDEAVDFAVPGFDASVFSASPQQELPQAPLAPMKSTPAGVSDDWASAFESPAIPPQPVADDPMAWAADAATPPVTDAFETQSPLVELETSWDEFSMPSSSSPPYAADEAESSVIDPLSPHYELPGAVQPMPDFYESVGEAAQVQGEAFLAPPEAYISQAWSDEALLPEGLSPGFSTGAEAAPGSSDFGMPVEPVADWHAMPEAPAASFPQDLGVMAKADAAPLTSLDALWDSSQVVEAGPHTDLSPSGFSAPMTSAPDSAASGIQPLDITESQLPAKEVAPTYQPTLAPDAELPAFDPMQASQALAAGWSQMEHIQQETEEPSSGWEATELSSLAGGMEWANISNAPPEPVYFHEPPASAQAEAQLWNNLSSGDTAPGEQVPYTSGAMMDAINEQLYPADPFSSVDDEFSAGEQAFADAAKYLFPETVSAPLDWEEGGYGSSDDAESSFFGDEDEEVSVLNLGPSYSAPNDTLAELPSSYTEPATAYEAYPQPEAFSGIAHELSQSAEAQPTVPYYQPSLPEDLAAFLPTQTAFEPAPPMPMADSGVVAPSDFPLEEEVGSVQHLGFPEGFEPAPNVVSSAESEAAYGEPVVWTPDTVSTSGFASMESPLAETQSTLENSMEYTSAYPAYDEFWESVESLATLTPAPEAAPQADAPALPQEDDFYATSFTLNERGELVPLHEDELAAEVETHLPPGVGAAPVSSNLMSHSGPLPPSPMTSAPQAEPQAPPYASEPPVRPAFSPEQFLAASRSRFTQHPETPLAAAPMGQTQPLSPSMQPSGIPSPAPIPAAPEYQSQPRVEDFGAPDASAHATSPQEPQVEPEEPKTIRPKPLNRKMPQMPVMPPVPEPQSPVQSLLESQWYSPEQPAPSALAPGSRASGSAEEMNLTLGNLEVVGLCQLPSDKRLMVVHSNGVYALMGQSGQEAEHISVLKVFEHNPLAYQNTFTAVEEARAASQGMFVTQVGTWRAIISTFQDKITLHTELG